MKAEKNNVRKKERIKRRKGKGKMRKGRKTSSYRGEGGRERQKGRESKEWKFNK